MPNVHRKDAFLNIDIYRICIDLIYLLECRDALGMENHAISDGHISSSSEYNSQHRASYGRLHKQQTQNEKGGWSARTNDVNQWLQIDLVSEYTKVTGVATQGTINGHNEWVTQYKLQYSNDGVSYQYYREQGQSADKVKYNLFHRNANYVQFFIS